MVSFLCLYIFSSVLMVLTFENWHHFDANAGIAPSILSR
jgi:hypothetical protein